MKKITVAGTGYVGLSNAVLLAQHNQVTAIDIAQDKVEMLNRKQSPIVDKEISDYLAHKTLHLTARAKTISPSQLFVKTLRLWVFTA